jgi:superfamily I DNA/RNA helicase
MPALPELPVGGDEDDAHAEAPAAVGAYLKEYLIMHQAMLPEELSYLCTLFVKHDLWRAVALGFDHVMVDDFQNISKTSQIVCEALAKKSFVVTGNTKAPVINREAFPYPEGLARFAEEHDQAITITLEGANDGEAAGSPDDPSSTGIMLEVSAQQLLNIKWKTPEDEARGISQWIRKLTSGNKGARLSDFYLVVPNSHWAGAFERSLTSQFREHVTLLDGQLLSGDSHEPGHNLALSAFTRLNLLAQPSDPFAWRCWCGLGVADLGAKSWKHLLELAKTENLAVSEVLARLSKDTSCDKAGSSYFKELQRRYLEGMDFIERNQRKTGYALLKAVAGEDPDKAFSLLIEPFEGTEDAQTTFNQVGRGALDPSISRRHEAVRILSYGELTGLSPQTVVLVGLNDGLMPPVSCFASPIIELEREPFGKDYQALFRDTVGKASKTLVFSTTQKIEQKTAESLGIRAARLKTEHETTMAMLSPSCFLQEAGSLIPGSESGEYFLSRP